MKRSALIFVSLMTAFLFFLPLKKTFALSITDTFLMGELNAAYQTLSYPGVVEYACQLENSFPRSSLLGKALSKKGESLYLLGNLREAESELSRALELTDEKSEEKVAALYYLGRTYYDTGRFEKAFSSFVLAAEVYGKTEEKTERADYTGMMSFLYGGKTADALHLPSKAILPYEQVVKNGKYFTNDDYYDAFVRLLKDYILSGESEKGILLYESIPGGKGAVPDYLRDNLVIAAGDCYSASGAYKKAYECYASVLTEGSSVLSPLALQKTYLVASEHPSQVGQDAGSVLNRAKSYFQGDPEILAEFWTRLGIDSYRAKDYKKALSYFDSAESTGVNTYRGVSGLYRAEIEGKKSPEAALSILEKYKKELSINESSSLYADYLASSVKWNAILSRWAEVLDKAPLAIDCYFSSDLPWKEISQEQLSFWYSLALFKSGDAGNAELILSDMDLSFSPDEGETRKSCQILYAQTLSFNGKNEQALGIMEKLDSSNLLSSADLLEFSKILIKANKFSKARDQALKSGLSEGFYLAGLASFNEKKWNEADGYFQKYISSSSKEKLSYAVFYHGYSQYKNSSSLSAYRILSDFVKKYPDHPLASSACLVCANISVQNGKYQDGITNALNAVRLSGNREEKQNAVLLCAGIYTDAKEYDNAVELLSPYTVSRDDFGLRARYLTARIYGRQGNLRAADIMYGNIVDAFRKSSIADESEYRRGELYYGAEDWKTSAERFSEYRKVYPNGKFVDASYFYEASALSKDPSTLNMAVVQLLSLLSTMSDSPYAYSARKNLVEYYSMQEKYSQALAQAKELLSLFPDQGEKDGIDEEVKKLERIVSGSSSKLASLQLDYEKKGLSSSFEGRKAGTELAQALWDDNDMKSQAVELAALLYEIQSRTENEEKESFWAAKTSSILAQSKRADGAFKEAGDFFLSSAKYARMSGNDSLAERSLYGACEAFYSLGLEGDAKAASATLNELYPSSEYSLQAEKLVNGK